MWNSTGPSVASKWFDGVPGHEAEIRIGGPETQAQPGVTPSETTGQPRQIRRGTVSPFNKYYDIGANKIMTSRLFCVNTRILNLILRDSSYGGRYYGSTGLIARELGMDEENVRKRIAAMEGEDLLIRVVPDTGSRYILLNPRYFCAGGQDDEDMSKRIWARERMRLIKARA